MIRVARTMVLIGVVVSASSGRGARADPAPAVDKKPVAKRYVDAGVAAQQTGDYDTAIAMFEKAYQLVPHPTLIFDIAQAQRLAGHLAEALLQYRRYVAAEPSGPGAQTARNFIAELEAKLGAAAPAPGDDGARTDGPAPSTDRAGTGITASGEAPLAGPGTAEDSHARTIRVLGMAAGAAGVAGLAVGVGFGLHARKLADQVSTQWDPNKNHSGSLANKIAITGYVSGGVLLATGMALYWWGYTHDRVSEHAVVVPALSSQGAGLALVGSWR